MLQTSTTAVKVMLWVTSVSWPRGRQAQWTQAQGSSDSDVLVNEYSTTMVDYDARTTVHFHVVEAIY